LIGIGIETIGITGTIGLIRDNRDRDWF